MFGRSNRRLQGNVSRTTRQRKQLGRKFESLEDRRMLANFAVTSTTDRVLDTAIVTLAHRSGADGKLTLREAIYLANINPGPDVVTLKAKSVYKIRIAGGDEDLDKTGDFDVLGDLTINKSGSGADPIIDGNGLDRVLNIPEGYDHVDLTTNNLVITGGIARGTNGFGGGVGTFSNFNTLTFNYTTIRNNITTSPGGGLGGGIFSDLGDVSLFYSHVDNNSAAAGVDGLGGGIFMGEGHSALTIKNSTVNGNSAYQLGGGIFAPTIGAFTVTDSHIDNNHSGEDGAGGAGVGADVVKISGSWFSGNTTAGFGGGLYVTSQAPISIYKSNFIGNSAAGDGGGLWSNEGRISISKSTFQDNTSTGGNGGGVSGVTTIQVTDSFFTHNVANGLGGGISQEDSGEINILRSTFTKNAALFGTGGAINGDGDAAFRITSSKFTYNSALEQGGGIAANGSIMTILSSLFDHNVSVNDDGGAIDSAQITATDTCFSYNTSKADGGGFNSENQDIKLIRCLVLGNTATNGEGGGFTDGGPETSITLIDCTISKNTAGGNGGGFAAEGVTLNMYGCTVDNNKSGSAGGGAYIITSGEDTDPYPDGPAPVAPGSIIANCTFSDNGAAFAGGGLTYDGPGDLTIVNCTIVYNAADSGGGIAQLNGGDGFIHIGNTILALNTANNGPDAYNISANPFDDLGHNLVFADPDSLFTGPGDIFGVDPLLGPLQNNGGPTKTHALLTGSQAIDNGDDLLAPATDQRGVDRPQGEHADIGAYEWKATPPKKPGWITV